MDMHQLHAMMDTRKNLILYMACCISWVTPTHLWRQQGQRGGEGW
jgi:hypothetical protein